jgi:hypothetical protein
MTAPVRNPIGGSFCMRRVVFDEVGGFDTELGRVGTTPPGLRGTELSIRARRRWPDGQFVFEPRSRVATASQPNAAGGDIFVRAATQRLSKAVLASRLGSRDGLSSERAYLAWTLPSGLYVVCSTRSDLASRRGSTRRGDRRRPRRSPPRATSWAACTCGCSAVRQSCAGSRRQVPRKRGRAAGRAYLCRAGRASSGRSPRQCYRATRVNVSHSRSCRLLKRDASRGRTEARYSAEATLLGTTCTSRKPASRAA